jgi:hypothetical protein
MMSLEFESFPSLEFYSPPIRCNARPPYILFRKQKQWAARSLRGPDLTAEPVYCSE